MIDVKEYQKEYREENKEKLKLQKQKYYKDNKEDIRKTNKEYYFNNIEEAKKYNKEYYVENKERIDKHSKEYYKANRDNIKMYGEKFYNSLVGKYTQYKSRAKQRNKKFSLTKEEFNELWNKPCFYCGDEIDTIGVDRIDSSKGYVKGNIVPCCTKCNVAKNTMTPTEYLKHCNKVIEFNNNKINGGN